jgi:hypothetical protein
MRQKLFTVEDRFYVQGRKGTVLVGNAQSNTPTVNIKDEIILIRPDIIEIVTEVDGIEMPLTVSGVRKIAISIENVTKEDVPVGTEVFLRV